MALWHARCETFMWSHLRLTSVNRESLVLKLCNNYWQRASAIRSSCCMQYVADHLVTLGCIKPWNSSNSGSMHSSNNNYNTNNNDFYCYFITSHKFILRTSLFLGSVLRKKLENWILLGISCVSHAKRKQGGVRTKTNSRVIFQWVSTFPTMCSWCSKMFAVLHFLNICQRFATFSEIFCRLILLSNREVVGGASKRVWFHEFAWICNSDDNNIVVIF